MIHPSSTFSRTLDFLPYEHRILSGMVLALTRSLSYVQTDATTPNAADETFDRFKLCATTHNNMQQGVQTDATRNIQQCWELLANNVASVCKGI